MELNAALIPRIQIRRLNVFIADLILTLTDLLMFSHFIRKENLIIKEALKKSVTHVTLWSDPSPRE